MPSIPLTITAGVNPIIVGNRIEASYYSAGFDHAALVAAYRSRADGYDLYMRHATAGAVTLISLSGANTSNCRVVFVAAFALAPAGVDAGYSIIFGNLGATLPTYGAGLVGVIDASVTPGAVPAVALPSPGFPLDRSDDQDADGTGYPETLSPRWQLRNQNDRPVFTLQYANISPEEWYEIRAFKRAKRGGASTWSPPAWLYGASAGVASTDLFRLVGCSTTQGSRKEFMATVECERCAA
jgi:hypothetical protein